ncbi:CAAX prenyl protease 2 [Quercus lobata]|uniref:CAAX prenyl protease 2 n=1 Tax=Quercus lobata TaxID=97700 RepID=UPI001248D798|nr:CAAX prenyl protease 2 [Quercus lobata]
MEEEAISKSAAVTACTAMALLYVAILHAPTLILRLPPPPSFNSFMIRRFICAAISSVLSLLICTLILPIRSKEASILFDVYGIRVDHIWQAVVFPVSLTSLMYAGSLVLKALLLVDKWRERVSRGEEFSYEYIQGSLQGFIDLIISVASNVSAWRNFVVAPLTEELVFRACMIPLLLCGGFKPYTAIRLCPIFFSLAHLNHLMEFYSKQNFSLIKTFMVVGLQLGYTVIFGSYASFLYIRTGHLLAPLVAHSFCNFMGLPALFSRRNGMVSVAFVAGMVGFLWLLFPMTHPDLYNDRSDSCKCWHGYCSWS